MVPAERRLSGADETSKTAGRLRRVPFPSPVPRVPRGDVVPPRHLHELVARDVRDRVRDAVGRVRGQAVLAKAHRFIRRRMVSPSHRARHRQHLRRVQALAHLVLVLDARLQLGTQHVPHVFARRPEPRVPHARDLSHPVLAAGEFVRAFVRSLVSLGALLRGFPLSFGGDLLRGFARALVLLLRSLARALAVVLPRLVEPPPVPLAHRDDR